MITEELQRQTSKIIKRRAQPQPQAAQEAEPAKAAPSVPAGQVSFEELPVSQMRKTIARSLAESKFSAPHFYLTMSIDMDAALQHVVALMNLVQ